MNKYASMFNQPTQQTNQPRTSIFGQNSTQYNPIQPQRTSVFQQNIIQQPQPTQTFQMGGKSVFSNPKTQPQTAKPIQSKTSIFDRQPQPVSFDPKNIFGQKEINITNDYDMEMDDESESSKPNTSKPKSSNMTEQEHLEAMMETYGIIKII
jgi:hypothetical protein